MVKAFVIGLVFFYGFHLFSQEHAWVYFKDKENVSLALANPSLILTDRALARKTRFNIPVDARDIPVNEAYVSQLKSQNGITVKAKSKWFNNAHVLGSVAAIENLKSLAFVEMIVYADRSLNAKKPQDTDPIKIIDNHSDKTFAVHMDYNYGTTETQVKQIRVDALHAAGFTGEGMLIAVMDGGFPNVDLLTAFQRIRSNNDLLGGYDFVDRNTDIFRSSGDEHGTNVLSDMAGFVQDQFVGTAPDASYVLFRTEDVASETPVEESYWVEAAERADSLGVDLINTSLGYSTYDNPRFSFIPADMDGQTALISRGANIATEKGMLVVVSAGNSGNSAWGIVTAPADANVFTVGAVDANGTVAGFSSRGPNIAGAIKPDGMALGVNAAVIGTNNNIGTANGTSFASPILAGAIASFWQALPDTSNLAIMQLVRESASRFANPNADLGFGIPNFEKALELAGIINPGIPEIPSEGLEDLFAIFPNPSSGNLSIRFRNLSEPRNIIVFDSYGKKVFEEKLIRPDTEINLEQLSNALYIIHLDTSEGVKKFKFLKK